MNVQTFITAVHARRPLWDRKHEFHHSRDLIEALWNEVAVICAIPVTKARAKWKNLKDTFRREAKKVFVEGKYYPRWRLYQPLIFLYDQQDFEGQDDKNSDNPNILMDQESVSKIEYDYDDVHMGQDSDSKSLPLRTSFEEVNTNMLETETYISSVRNDLHSENEDLCFFRSLIPHMKDLSPQKRMLLRMKINEMVYKEVYSASNTQ